MLTSDQLNKSFLGPRIKNLAKIVNSEIIHMDRYLNNEVNLSGKFKIDKEKYKNYLNSYIKMPNSLDIPLWEIFSKNIKNIIKDN